jgi:hypothetical protein
VGHAQPDGTWIVGSDDASPAIYAYIATTTDKSAPLYCDWESSATDALTAALGRLPTWCVVADISGRIPADAEVRAFVLPLLAGGGVVQDDYSDHCWTAAEITADARVDGLSFFDHRESYRRHQRSRGE